MTNKQLEQRLASAAVSLKTDLPFERIAQAVPAPVAPVPFPRRRRRHYAVVAAIVACMVLLLGGGLLWYRIASPASPAPSDPPAVTPPVTEMVYTVIDIDVNPSVEITVDSSDRISAVAAVNADAALLLTDLDLTQQPLAEGVETLFDVMVAYGYATDAGNQILVTVQSGDPAEADRLHAMVNSGVDAAMAQHCLTASVVNQTVTTFDEVTEFAQKHGISYGKAAFVLSLVEQQPTLKAEELVHYAFSALAAIAQHHNIPLSELVDYDAEGSLWQSILHAHVMEFNDEDAMRWGGILSVSEIKELALKAMPSEYIAENALLINVDTIIGNEQLLYHVELVSLGYLYEYVIDANDGTFQNPGGTTSSTTPNDSSTVRSTLAGGGTRVPVELPDEKDSKTTTTSPPTTAATTAPTTTATRPTAADSTLTEERAKEIVFFRLGVTEAEVRDLSVGHKTATNETWVRLFYSEYFYCFWLNSTTGDGTKVVVLPTDIPVSDYRINEWDAMAIALEDADLTEEECGEITIMYYFHNEAPLIFVGWTVDDVVYSYRIDGVYGDVAQKDVAPIGGDAPPAVVIP